MHATPISLIYGLLLMTLVVPLQGAADTTANEILLTDFTSNSGDLGWYVRER